tara:strand:+ start:1374 stop:1589 length:216 start_codon:yes stop_codon:yes gene_type:complete
MRYNFIHISKTQNGLFDPENDDPVEMDYSCNESDTLHDGTWVFMTLIKTGMMQANDLRDRGEGGKYTSNKE